MQLRIPVVLYVQCPLLKENCFSASSQSSLPKGTGNSRGEWKEVKINNILHALLMFHVLSGLLILLSKF